MNFKDAYKSYNDEIKGDPKVLEAILNKDKKETEKESRKVFFIRPSFVGAMAAMVVIAVSVFGFGNFNNTSKSPQKTYIAATNPKENKTDIIPDTRIVPDNTAGDNIQNIASDGVTDNISIAQPDVASNENTHSNELQIGSANYEPDVSDNLVTESDNQVATANEEQIGVEISPEIATLRNIPEEDMNSNTEQEEDNGTVNTEECYSYFGFDVTKKAKLPQDMSFGGNVIINAEKSQQTGNLEFCSFAVDAFSETNPQRMLDLCVAKQNTPSEITDIEYFVSSETGNISGGCFSSGEISVSVNSLGLTKEEVTDILTSFK